MANALTKVREALSRLGSGSRVRVRTSSTRGEPLSPAQTLRPNTDVYENESQFMIVLDVPGLDGKDVDIASDGRQVTVRGPVDTPFARGYVWQRSFSLPVDVDPGKARASCALGVLRIELPKRKAETKHIRVRRAA